MKKVLRFTTTFSLAALLTFSSLMSPVVAAYGLNEAKPAEAVTDVASAGDDGVAARGDDVEGSDATVDQSPVEGDFEAIDSLSQGATESDVKTEQEVDSVESDFQYVYLAYPSLPSGSNQVIAFATHNDGEVLSSATLGYVSANGVKGSVDASATADNSAAFTFGAKLEAITYFLTSISYYLEGDGTEHKIDLSDRDYSFTVVDSSMNSEGTSVYYADGDGNAVEAQSIQQALECADSPDGVFYAARSARNVSVIALDAGHGGSDPGAQGNGKSEADLTWKIVTACKNKLEAYGFKVVLAREQYGNYSGNDFLYRVQRCIDQGAQAFVSFHINSGSSAAHGAEVYAPTANGSDYTQVSVELANKVM
ncbi:MAG: N-acetylmuramoyl-L-alanine amidase, partial [Collinsella sp.]